MDALLKATGRGGWAGKQLRHKTSKAHHGTSLAQILSSNSPHCSPLCNARPSSCPFLILSFV